MVSKVIRFATEKILSVENDLLSYQYGDVASGTNASVTFVPCDLSKVFSVLLTPVKLGTTSANLTALDNYEVDSLTTLSSVSDLSAWAASTAYIAGQLVSYSGKAYQCLEDHTSGTTFDSTKWKKLSATNFVKVNHVAAGAGKVAYFNFLLVGLE